VIVSCREIMDQIDNLSLDVTWKEDHRVIRALESELCSYPEVHAGEELARAEAIFWDMSESQLVTAFESLVERMGEAADDLSLSLNLWGMAYFVGLLCPKEARGKGMSPELPIWQARARACQETLARFGAIYVKLYGDKNERYKASDKYLGEIRPRTVLKQEFCAVCPNKANCPERGKIAAM
jgi:hypothetical protein